MGVILVFAKVCLIMSLSLWLASAQKNKYAKIFDVRSYGAVSDGQTENSKAFLKAWEEACKWEGKAVVLVPKGHFLLDSVVFSGRDPSCKGRMSFTLKGVLTPPTKLSNSELWISFQYLKGLTVSGGGFLDAEGEKVWNCGGPGAGVRCRITISLGFGHVENGNIHHLRSVNSRNAHIALFGCNNMTLNQLRISSPKESPNTDGIKIGASTRIRVLNTKIRTGDDCIAIIRGSKRIRVHNVHCGPGHGISVGSMGEYPPADIITGLTVTNCTLEGADNGLRIKTWSSPVRGLASRFTYDNIRMINVSNPIIIDQHYCPSPPCDQTTPSKIQIRDITYKNIWGTTTSKVAINLNCSRSFPCKNIVLKNINLSRIKGETGSLCWNVKGISQGVKQPEPCF